MTDPNTCNWWTVLCFHIFNLSYVVDIIYIYFNVVLKAFNVVFKTMHQPFQYRYRNVYCCMWPLKVTKISAYLKCQSTSQTISLYDKCNVNVFKLFSPKCLALIAYGLSLTEFSTLIVNRSTLFHCNTNICNNYRPISLLIRSRGQILSCWDTSKMCYHSFVFFVE